MLVRLLYASRALDGIDQTFLKSIQEQSRASNLEHGITGILCAHPQGGVFIQVLEGGREAVNRLFGNIVRDERHSDVTILHYAEIEERRFAGWRMGNVDLNKVNLSSILRYSEKGRARSILDERPLRARAPGRAREQCRNRQLRRLVDRRWPLRRPTPASSRRVGTAHARPACS